MTEKCWGDGSIQTGMACLGYDWIYRPLCTYILHVEPWSITWYGVAVLVTGLALNLVHHLADGRPLMRRLNVH